MGKYFHMTARWRSLPPRSRTQRVQRRLLHDTSVGKLLVSQQALSIGLLLAFAVMSMLYLVMVNARVTKGFDITGLEKRLTELQKNHKALEQQAADLQSIQAIERGLTPSGFVPTENVSYMRVPDFAQK